MKAIRKPSFSARGGWKDSAGSDFFARGFLMTPLVLGRGWIVAVRKMMVSEILGCDRLSKKVCRNTHVVDLVLYGESENELKKAISWRLFTRVC